MNGLPYYKRYPRDFIEGTINMPFELKGAYAIILDLIYMQGGELPDDPRYISGVLGMSVRKWNSLRKQLIEMDKIQVTGVLLTNYRSVIELESLSKYRDKQAENARGPRKNKDLQKPKNKPKQNHTEPEPDTDKKTSKKELLVGILSGVLTRQVAEEFYEHRMVLKKPMTEMAAKRIVSKLGECDNPDAVVGRSIENGWIGIFPDSGRKAKQNGVSGEFSAFGFIPEHSND